MTRADAELQPERRAFLSRARMAERLSPRLTGTAAAFVLLLASALFFDSYSLTIFAQAFSFAIVAVTVDLLWGYTGILSYAQSAFFGIGAYAVGLAFTYLGLTPLTVAGALLSGLLVAALLGVAIGAVSFHARASWLFVAVVTFAAPVILTQVILAGGKLTGSSSGLSGFPTPDLSFAQWYTLFGALLIVFTLAAHVVVGSDAGRILKAIRENDLRCQYLGLETASIKTALLVGCGVVAAFAGCLYAAFADVVAPELAGFVLGTEFVIWTALGGRGTLFGAILATVAINVVSARLGGSLPFVWTLIVGIVFVLVVVYFPAGFLPALNTLARKVRDRLIRSSGEGSPRDGATVLVADEPAEGALAQRAPEAGRLALELRAVTKHFGSLRVLNDVDLQVRCGELLSIIGPNGAGKTTLMRCISDGRERTGGSVAINGESIGRRPPHKCVELGLGRKFQTANIFEGLTVRDCLLIARSYRVRPSLWRSSRTVHLPDAALRVVRSTGLDGVLDVRTQHLPHGMKQALELAMVLSVEPSVVLLDEPTAGLTRDEQTAIGSVLVELARSHQLCVVLVEHDLDFVREISSRVVVLHQGRVLLDGTVDEVVESELVKNVYAGTVRAGVASRDA